MPALPSIGCANFSNNDASTLKPAEHPACAEGHDRNASRCAKISCESSLSLTRPVTASLRPWWHAKLCMSEHGWDAAGCIRCEERAETSEESDCNREDQVGGTGGYWVDDIRGILGHRQSSSYARPWLVVHRQPVYRREKQLEIRVCGHNQARRLTVKDGSKLSELSSAASSISICCLRARECTGSEPRDKRERHSYVPETLRALVIIVK
jgi:hypothetical protein